MTNERLGPPFAGTRHGTRHGTRPAQMAPAPGAAKAAAIAAEVPEPAILAFHANPNARHRLQLRMQCHARPLAIAISDRLRIFLPGGG